MLTVGVTTTFLIYDIKCFKILCQTPKLIAHNEFDICTHEKQTNKNKQTNKKQNKQKQTNKQKQKNNNKQTKNNTAF